MISLYKDPQGINIFEKTASSAKDSADKGGIAMATKESMARLPPNNNQEPSDIMSMSLDGVCCCASLLFSLIFFSLQVVQ